jgi:multiple sugar transport system substrate-binding protein
MSVTRRDFLRGGLAVGAGLGAFSLSGCAGGRQENEISFWNFYGPGGSSQDQSDWFVALADEWNESHRVKVRLRYLPFGDYSGGPNLQTAFSAGEGPDVFLLSPGDFLRYVNAGALADLTPHLPPGVQQEYLPGSLETRTVNGRVYGLPMEREPVALFYSKDAFEQAGIKNPPKTWPEMLDIAEELTTADRFGLLLETIPGYYQNFTWYPFLWMAGGSPISDDQRHSAFSGDGAVRALKIWQDTITRGVAPRRGQGVGANDSVGNMAAGYCAMQQTGIWAIGELAELAPDFRYGVVPLPAPEGGRSVASVGGWAIVANAKSPHREDAAEFVAWALGRDDPACVDRGRRWNTELKRNLPPRAAVQRAAEQRGAFDDPAVRVFTEQIAPSSRGEPRYPVPIYRAISDALQSCQLDGVTPEDAAGAAADQINTYLSTYEGATIL